MYFFSSSRKTNILVVEDNNDDYNLIKRFLRKGHVACTITRAKDGIEALNILKEGRVKEPIIVILDLNLPNMNGIEFLRAIRSDKRFSDICVFVVTDSEDDKDQIKAYKEDISGYIKKKDLGKLFLC
jgi:CheY-like chemotaxis protein